MFECCSFEIPTISVIYKLCSPLFSVIFKSFEQYLQKLWDKKLPKNFNKCNISAP